MNCNDCIDQVLELIEREAVDPDGVGEILARCPDCRRLFQELKATLASAEGLPIEEPPVAADAAIVRAAAARVPRERAFSRHWLKAPPWAAAAVALLAIGIGLWAVPAVRRAEHGGEPPHALVQAEIEPAVRPEASPVREEPAAPGVVEQRKVAAARGGTPMRRTAPATAKRSPLAGDEALAAEQSEPVPAAADDAMAEIAAASGAPVAQAAAPASSLLSKQCRRRIARIEERRPDAGDHDVSPEDALALGRCYQAAGDRQRARLWLARAAADPKTRSRAERALRELDSD